MTAETFNMRMFGLRPSRWGTQLKDRGPNTNDVCTIEQSQRQSCIRPLPYMVVTFFSEEEADELTRRFTNAGATAVTVAL